MIRRRWNLRAPRRLKPASISAGAFKPGANSDPLRRTYTTACNRACSSEVYTDRGPYFSCARASAPHSVFGSAICERNTRQIRAFCGQFVEQPRKASQLCLTAWTLPRCGQCTATIKLPVLEDDSEGMGHLESVASRLEASSAIPRASFSQRRFF